MVNQEKKSGAAVYVAWGTFKNAIEALAQGVPNRIDKTVYPGLNPAVVNQLLAGFKFLGLIEHTGKPTPTLVALAVKDEGLRKRHLDVLIRERYADLFGLDLQKTTPAELTEKMQQSFGVGGETVDRAVRFFMGAVTYLDIPVSALLRKTSHGGFARRRGRTPKVQAPPPAADGRHVADGRQGQGGSSRVIELKSGGTLTLSASLNYLSLSLADREFFNDLIDRLDEYEKGAGQGPNQG